MSKGSWLKKFGKKIKKFFRRHLNFLKSGRYPSFPPPLSFEFRSDDFKKDLLLFQDKLNKGESFAFSRWGDGEMAILRGLAIDILDKEHGEFKYDPLDESDELYRNKMWEAFKFNAPNYFVGIGCPCCVGAQSFQWMKEHSKQDEAHLTWANLFVNANYDYFKKCFVNDVLLKKKIVLVCNNKANTELLPFKIEKDFRVARNSWRENYLLIDEIGRWIDENDIKGRVFLFCAGPLSNMLVHQLYLKYPENTYLDAGSVLDPFMGLGATRDYLGGGFSARKICTWDAWLQSKKIFFCYGPAYGRREMLRDTVRYNAMYFPAAKIKIATNDRAVARMKIRGVDAEIRRFASNQGHQLACINSLISSVQMALATADPEDVIIFAHEDCRIHDINLMQKAILQLQNGYGIVVRNWLTGEYKARHGGLDSYFVFDTVFMRASTANKIFVGQDIIKNRDAIRFAEDFFTNAVKTVIPEDSLFSIDYHHSTWGSNELGFFHLPSGEEPDDWKWDKSNYNDIYSRNTK